MAPGQTLVGSIALAFAGCALVVEVPEVMEGRRPEDVRRKRIEIAAPVTTDHANVPIAIIRQEDPDLVVRARPENLAFFSDDEVPLPHELQKLDPDTGALIAWVHVPLVRAGVSTAIYLHYGGPDRAPIDPGEVWPRGYVAVWHLDEPGPTQIDSTASHRVAEVTSAAQPAGDDGSLVFTGSELLEVEDPPGGQLDFQTESFTYSAWVRLDADPVGSAFPLRKGGVPETSAGYAIHLNPVDWETAVSDGVNQRELGFGNSLGPWKLLTVIVDRDASEPTVCAYTDGSTDGHSSMAGVGSVSNDDNLVMGLDLVGRLDEVRIHRGALAEDRLLLEFRNIAAPEAMLTFGGEQEL